jgi:hypothetical protein
VRFFVTALVACGLIAVATGARAQDEDEEQKPGKPAAPTPAPVIPANLSVSATRPDAVIDSGPPAEAPPPRPWSKGIVVEGSLGVLGYMGAFRRLAPPAFFQRVQVGYELFEWLLVYGGGELAFTDTSVGQDESKSRAFPIWGFDGGARFTVRPTPRVGIFAQGSIGLMKADVPANSLAVIGFPDTESLHLFFGGRLGVEWYQIDHHLAFGLVGGPRLATGFERSYGRGDTPLMWDAALTLRYGF